MPEQADLSAVRMSGEYDVGAGVGIDRIELRSMCKNEIQARCIRQSGKLLSRGVLPESDEVNGSDIRIFVVKDMYAHITDRFDVTLPRFPERTFVISFREVNRCDPDRAADKRKRVFACAFSVAVEQIPRDQDQIWVCIADGGQQLFLLIPESPIMQIADLNGNKRIAHLFMTDRVGVYDKSAVLKKERRIR